MRLVGVGVVAYTCYTSATSGGVDVSQQTSGSGQGHVDHQTRLARHTLVLASRPLAQRVACLAYDALWGFHLHVRSKSHWHQSPGR